MHTIYRFFVLILRLYCISFAATAIPASHSSSAAPPELDIKKSDALAITIGPLAKPELVKNDAVAITIGPAQTAPAQDASTDHAATLIRVAHVNARLLELAKQSDKTQEKHEKQFQPLQQPQQPIRLGRPYINPNDIPPSTVVSSPRTLAPQHRLQPPAKYEKKKPQKHYIITKQPPTRPKLFFEYGSVAELQEALQKEAIMREAAMLEAAKAQKFYRRCIGSSCTIL